MQVSTMMVLSGVFSAKAWKEIFMMPSGVANCGISQGWSLPMSGVHSVESIVNGSWWAFTSTIRVTCTSPICQWRMFSIATCHVPRAATLSHGVLAGRARRDPLRLPEIRAQTECQHLVATPDGEVLMSSTSAPQTSTAYRNYVLFILVLVNTI